MSERRHRARAPCAALLALATLAIPAAADPRDAAERAIHYRHSVYHVIEWNVIAMADVIKGRTAYDPAAFSMRAQRVAALVPMLLEGFPPGSYIAGHTLARETVWSDRATFEGLLQKLGTRSVALANAANGGELAAIRPAFQELEDTCHECHKKFKQKDEH